MKAEQEHQTSATNGHHLGRSLTWRGGVALALVIPMSGLTLVGYEVGAIGAYGALVVWLGVAVIAFVQNFIFSELAGMFPGKTGGISLYASEIWSSYFAPLGAILGWGYWAGWSLTLAVVSLVIGDLVQAQWFPHDTSTVTVLGNPIGLPTYIAAAIVVVIFLVNIAGLKPVVNTNIIIGAALAILAAVCIVGPLVLSQVHFSSLTFSAGSGVGTVLITLLTWWFVASWTGYGTEIVASFTPEYRDGHRDMARALRTSALIMIVVVALSCTILPAAVGQSTVAKNPIGFFAILVSNVLGHAWGSVAIAIVCLAQLIALGSATSDSGRTLHGMANDRLTVRQLAHINKNGQPSRGMTVDLVFNLLILFLVKNVAGIIFASNLGYLLAVIFALAGFLLLRRTHPNADRLHKLGRGWIPIAAVLLVFNIVMTLVGFDHPALVGYGGATEQLISLSVIVIGIISYFYARVIQDGQRKGLLRTPSERRHLDSQEASMEAE